MVAMAIACISWRDFRFVWFCEKMNFISILMDFKTPSLAKMKRICAWKFVPNSDIGCVMSRQKFLEIKVSLIKTSLASLV